jgi:filamentous hemagglutinin family protein
MAARSRWLSLLLGVALVEAAPLAARAEVTTDGSLGPAGPVAGGTLDGRAVDYLIAPELGAQRGGNLFHSFGAFSIEGGRVAAFTGPAEVQHVISRVTGGAPSQIDGTLRSNIPGASVYLVNPSGVVFGESAQLEVRGGFWASTADAVRLADGETFAARADAPLPPLAVAPPESFGFLSTDPAPIELNVAGNLLRGAARAPLGLVGGEVTIASEGGAPGYVWTQGGRLVLAAAASDGSAPVWVAPFDPASDAIGVSGPAVGRDIAIESDAVVSSSGVNPANPFAGFGQGAGDVLVWGDSLVVRDAELRAQTGGRDPGGDVRVELSGELLLSQLDVQESGIFAGTGVVVSENATIGGTGDGGNVTVRARRVLLEGGALLSSTSEFLGDAGDVSVDARESIEIRGQDPGGERSAVFSRTVVSGAGGRISLRAPLLLLSDSGAVVAETRGFGSGGDIDVDVERLVLEGNGRIDSSTRSFTTPPASGGSIAVRASESIAISGRQSDEEFSGITTLSQPEATGNGGTIEITTPFLLITDGGEVSARALGAGGAGTVTIDGATEVRLLRDGGITTDAASSVGGGIAIEASKLVYLLDSRIETSVAQGEGGGGDIAIDPEIVALNRGVIRAGADLGDGGNIRIVSGQFLATPDSVVDARNSLGISGDVTITAPDTDLSGQLAVLPAGFADPSRLLRSPCAASAREGSSFVVESPGGTSVPGGDAAPDAPLEPPPACPLQ